jgi:hypothetical protein
MGSGSSTKDDAAAVDAEGANVAVTLSIVKMCGRRCDPQVGFYRSLSCWLWVAETERMKTITVDLDRTSKSNFEKVKTL